MKLLLGRWPSEIWLKKVHLDSKQANFFCGPLPHINVHKIFIDFIVEFLRSLESMSNTEILNNNLLPWDLWKTKKKHFWEIFFIRLIVSCLIGKVEQFKIVTIFVTSLTIGIALLAAHGISLMWLGELCNCRGFKSCNLKLSQSSKYKDFSMNSQKAMNQKSSYSLCWRSNRGVWQIVKWYFCEWPSLFSWHIL